ncbi:DinB family protein [Metabacillus idriensis]|uniref:DinB family protein n=1 Tax=Metabacillus idriensis TaxID=324768 RepID=UPI003D2A68F1
MNTNEIFKEQLMACFFEDNWFASLETALKGLTEEQASWKTEEDTHSIWEIVNHLVFYNTRHLKLFNKVPMSTNYIMNEDTFVIKEGENWHDKKEQLFLVIKGWIEELEKWTEEELLSSIREDTNSPWISVLLNMTIHNASHIGQIILIRKLQGSWKKELSVS